MTKCRKQTQAEIEQIRNDVHQQTWYRSQHEDRKQKHKIEFELYDDFQEENSYWED